MSELARLEVENESLQFERKMLRRENERLLVLNRTLEERAAAAEQERERLRDYLRRMQRSLPWRVAQALRGLVGRRW